MGSSPSRRSVFSRIRNSSESSKGLVVQMVLDADAVAKLDEIKLKYDRLEANASPEAEAERASLADVAEKYTTYKEIKSMMSKLKSMWRTEASETRREKQLKSFTGLLEGRQQLEELLVEKLGLPSNKDVKPNQAYENVLKWEAEVKLLEAKLDEVAARTAMKEGMSTREARFGALP